MIRPIREDEYPLLDEFLYQAIFVRPGETPPPRSILSRPELQVYVEGFGARKADHCLLAESDGQVVGAVWVRIMQDYGHVDDETPSFALSLLPEYRGRGIGTQLMRAMLKLLEQKGYAQASLAVQKDNYALRLYRKLGFETVDENEQEYIMICRLHDLADCRGVAHGQNGACSKNAGTIPCSVSVDGSSENGVDPQRSDSADAHG